MVQVGDNIVQVGIHNSDITMDNPCYGRDFEWRYLTNSTLILLEFTLKISYSLLDLVSIIKSYSQTSSL